MFRKVHYRLTLLCGGITTFLLLVMSLLYLYVSESGLKQSHFLAFQRDTGNLIANFEQQTVISHTWLAQMESLNSVTMSVTDNGVPLLFCDRAQDEKRERTEREALEYYRSHYAITTDSPFQSYHTAYPFTSTDGRDYYASYACIPHENGETEILILFPLENQKKQIQNQRKRFAAIDFTAMVLLFLFSFFFTKKLLIPVEENRLEQIRFVAAASHELRTPLAVILSCTGAIRGQNSAKKASPEEAETFLSTIDSEGQRMRRLIDDMLFLSHSDSHDFQIRSEPMEPDTLLLNSYEAFEALANEKNIRFGILLPDSPMPPCLGDGERLLQLLAILLHNAVSYTPEGGSITLSLSYAKPQKTGTARLYRPDFYTIAVADSGIGIPDGEKSKIFQRFYRSETSRSAKEHFGLGLCIAEKIVRSFHGSIRVEDTPGGGSTFLLQLPFIQAPRPAPS